MQVYKAIKYIRLSYTDDKTVESDSVANQRRLIDDYIARHPEIEVGSCRTCHERRRLLCHPEHGRFAG